MKDLYGAFRSQAELDAQYNPSLRVPDAKGRLARYAETSRVTRERLACELNIRYGVNERETLDIFPAAVAHAPVFVFVHGGYWRSGSSKDFSFVANAMHSLGINTVVVNYALCPAVGIDEITSQVQSALAWVVQHISSYGGNPAKIVIGGHSAGAHLAAMCLCTDWSDYGLPPDPLAGAVLISGLYDLRPLRHSYLQPALQLNDRLEQGFSPLFCIRATRAVSLVTWGAVESDEFVRQSSSYHQASIEAGNTSEIAAIPSADHFSAIDGFMDPQSMLSQWVRQKA